MSVMLEPRSWNVFPAPLTTTVILWVMFDANSQSDNVAVASPPESRSRFTYWWGKWWLYRQSFLMKRMSSIKKYYAGTDVAHDHFDRMLLRNLAQFCWEHFLIKDTSNVAIIPCKLTWETQSRGIFNWNAIEQLQIDKGVWGEVAHLFLGTQVRSYEVFYGKMAIVCSTLFRQIWVAPRLVGALLSAPLTCVAK